MTDCETAAGETRIVIFARAPVPGEAKTRLIPALGRHGSAALAARMLAGTIETCLASRADAVELATEPAIDDARWLDWEFSEALQTSNQGEGGLGERLHRAAQRTLSRGQRVVLVGTDCPALTTGVIDRAIQALDDTDAVIIPAVDGGYVLLGLVRCDTELFADIAWSTSAVAQQTLDNLQRAHYSVTQLPELRDIDDPADLDSVPARWASDANKGKRMYQSKRRVLV